MQRPQLDPGDIDPRLAFDQYRQSLGQPLTIDHIALLRQYLQQQQAAGVQMPARQHVPHPGGSMGIRG